MRTYREIADSLSRAEIEEHKSEAEHGRRNWLTRRLRDGRVMREAGEAWQEQQMEVALEAVLA